ncbi:putative bifunctional diguanylate cyclase/phosphodiesterase [Aurantiacibacter gangjinensis]|uniref:Diguanylate cyclase n=1 Tax=Aurantiacibacter gangjinensis TaxID=502682 RepID=A0A0G9MRE6_9SPHN|nr:EAL domain-containing protein [Aurantiacibacter gangjinensis]APE29248.1 Sensory box/GGDEF family protein [Aurantiacibacter gangjinensis]KLE33302.1 diguanylate cyclase [Aurantiacibacter gangjinensis]
MSDKHSGLPSLPLRLSALQVIGLRDPGEGDWSRLRALQYAELHKVSVTRIAAHGLAAMLAVTLYAGDIATWILVTWLLGVILAVWNATRMDKALIDVERRGLQRSEFTRQAASVFGCTLPWVLALIFFVPQGSTTDHYALWALIAMLMAGSAASMASAPVAAIMFDLVVGFTGALSFLATGNIAFAIASGAYTLAIVTASFQSARTYLSAKIAEAGVAEKDEVVSLLLREYEEKASDWLWQVDTHRRIRSASPRFAFALGAEPDALEGQSFVRVIAGTYWDSGDFPPSLHELAEKLKRREHFSNLLVQVDMAGKRGWWELSGSPMHNEEGAFIGFRGVGSDVTEQRDRDDKIAYLARYDTLTGLPNRLMLTEALGDGLQYAEQWKTRCAFLMIDLDRFKAVNDSLGHQLGDKLLAEVSSRLAAVVGEGEQVGRLGGDEFAIVIRDAADRQRIDHLSGLVIETLSQPYKIDAHTLFIGASIGSAIGPRDGQSVEMLMRNADLALYKAKDEGGNSHFQYMPALHAHAEERRKLEGALRHAIANDEMELHFQPVVDARSEHIVSFEALLRWNSKEHGPVSPAKFIPLAEDTRLIVPVGDWVLREACREAARWPDEIKVAVNVSGEQLLEPAFASTIVRALAETGLPAHRLEVEVTESVFLRDGRTARQTLEEIMALGCSIALDDFGTGYSSLGYLRTLRFSTIKVDRSFVQGAAQDSQESLAIIRAVVAMAHSLDMSTTAEGVEDAEQAALIRELGCTKIQGYYFGRPMPAQEARSLVVKGRQAA